MARMTPTTWHLFVMLCMHLEPIHCMVPLQNTIFHNCDKTIQTEYGLPFHPCTTRGSLLSVQMINTKYKGICQSLSNATNTIYSYFIHCYQHEYEQNARRRITTNNTSAHLQLFFTPHSWPCNHTPQYV